MRLKVGDIVEFKKYEDMTKGEAMGISDDIFPKYGKITEVGNDSFFFIEDYGYLFNTKSVARVISNANDIHVGDEVLIKTTVGEVKGNHIWVSWVSKDDVVKVLKHKDPERFIIKESHYGMYIGKSRELVSDKSKAKIYTSQNVCTPDAKDMHLDAWEVLPYGD